MFIDKADILVRGGPGGDGAMSFRREKFVPKGGPDGGDGGRGGSVFFQANPRLRTLLEFARKPKFLAQRGESGSGRKRSGKSGSDLILDVPCGTVISQGSTILADLVHPGDRVLVAKGGRGGRGNIHFKSSIRQAPRIAERGEPAEERRLQLRLKVIADVGFVGMPNAGKSTLLSRLTRATPKIADYPFTTLYPNLGVAIYHNQEIVFADIPGLIEGSHTGKGLGHEFLRHIERTRSLVHVVDPMGFEGKTPSEAIRVINQELKSYSPELARKPQIIVVNKMDLTGADRVAAAVRKNQRKHKVLAVSGVSGQGIPELLAAVASMIAGVSSAPSAPAPAPVHVKLEPDFWVERDNGAFVVRGKRVEKLVAMTNFRYEEAIERTTNILKKMGVEHELAARGARSGDVVRIGEYEFDFRPEIPMHNRFTKKSRQEFKKLSEIGYPSGDEND